MYSEGTPSQRAPEVGVERGVNLQDRLLDFSAIFAQPPRPIIWGMAVNFAQTYPPGLVDTNSLM